jgi:hypothetical protein
VLLIEARHIAIFDGEVNKYHMPERKANRENHALCMGIGYQD